jgi:REP element-mobilizing transposase RayT
LVPRLEHGGELSIGRRKTARPVALSQPMHLVLRSSRAHGAWSLRARQHRGRIDRELSRWARRFGIRVYRAANAGNHLHLLVRTRHRLSFQNFLRAFAGGVARLVTGARAGRRTGKFWDLLAYSRVVKWGRDFLGVHAYVLQNEWQVCGPWSRQQSSQVTPDAAPP